MVSTPPKKTLVSWDYCSQYMENPHENDKALSPMVPYRHSASSRSFPPGTSPSHSRRCRVPSAARRCPSHCLCRVPSAARRRPRSSSFRVRKKVLPWQGDGTWVYSFLYASVHLFFCDPKIEKQHLATKIVIIRCWNSNVYMYVLIYWFINLFIYSF